MNVAQAYINNSYPRTPSVEDYPGCNCDMDAVWEAVAHASEAIIDYDLMHSNSDYCQAWVSEALAALQQLKAQRPQPLNTADASGEF